MVPPVEGGRLFEVLRSHPRVFGLRTVVIRLQRIVIELRKVFLSFLCCDPPNVQQPPQNFPMSTSGTDCKPSGVEWFEMSFAQIGIVVGEIEDRIKIDFGDRGVGRFIGIIANLDTRFLSPLSLDRLFLVNDQGRSRRWFARIVGWLWLFLHFREFALPRCGGRLLRGGGLEDGGH